MSPALETVTIHQPDFMPWLGFFDRWARADLLVILDDVQFLRRGWHHRDKIKTASGEAWLTVPVRKKGKYLQEIREVAIDKGADWPQAHLNALRHAYGRAPRFEEVFPQVEEVYLAGHDRLMDLNLDFLRLFAGWLGIAVPWRLASDFAVKSSKNERLVDLVQLAGGRVYLTGQGSRGYLEEDLFAARGLQVAWRQYSPRPYPQMHGEFLPGLSALDYFMNCRPRPDFFNIQTP